jgi:hypothetical protein
MPMRPYAYMLLLCVGCASSAPSALRAAEDNPNTSGKNTAGGSAAPMAPGSELAPLANAGPDQAVIRGSLVKLDGRRTFHPLGLEYTLRWSQISGEKNVTLSNADLPVPSFVAPPVVSTLTFRLVATGPFGDETEDQVTIKVVEQNPFEAPTIITTGDITVAPFTSVQLLAYLISGALDGDVTWRAVTNSTVAKTGVQSGPAGRTLDVSAPGAGYAIYAVEGSSQGLSSAPSFVVVAVTGATGSTTPEAQTSTDNPSALADIIKEPGDTVPLVTLQQTPASVWTQIAGDPVVLEKRTDGWLFVAPSTPQLLWFSFVSDGTSLRKTPLVRAVSIQDPSLDGVVAEAGPDQFAHPGNNVLLDAGASVTNAQSTFSWTQSFGTSVGLSGATGPTAIITAPEDIGDLIFLLSVGGTKGRTRPDSVVIKVRPTTENLGPEGQLTKTQTGSQTFSVTAAVKDPESDPVSCTWSTTGAATATPTSGMQTSVNVTTPPASIQARCCDSLGACNDFTLPLP